MDIDLSNSDMSRLTTMLTNAGVAFERSYGPNGQRIIEIGNVSFVFVNDGKMLDARVAALPPDNLPLKAWELDAIEQEYPPDKHGGWNVSQKRLDALLAQARAAIRLASVCPTEVTGRPPAPSTPEEK